MKYIKFIFNDNKIINIDKNNFDSNINTDKLYEFLQWLSINHLYLSKPTFLNLFYYETIIKGSTFLNNIKDCDIEINLKNKYLKNKL
jgi:hypothetical protein